MTVIISYVSAKHVIQVSDRRLTWITGPNAGQIADDDANKAVVICNRLVLAYTGLAQMTGQKTDEWALDVVAEVNPYNPQRVIESLCKRATEDFKKINLTKSSKKHAFVISGWAKFNNPDAPLTPFISAISNALSDKWQWLPEAESTFHIRTESLATRPFLLAIVGLFNLIP